MRSKRLASNNNQVQEGYKETEIGLIPEDWEVKDISALCLLQRGFDITESTRKFGNVPVYSSSGLAYFHNQAKVNPPGVVTGRKGILGKVFYIEEPFWPHDTTLWIKDFKGNDAKYISFFLTYFNLERFDASTSVPTLNRNNLATISIPVPPLPEQKAIAQTLSDVDTLIAALDKLIAKKRNIKTATMQQLLTGKTRLPGFGEGKGYKKTEVGVIPEDWNLRRLGEVAKIIMGQSPSSKYYNYKNIGIPLIQGNADIVNRYAVIRAYTSVITKKCNSGDIIMSVRAPVGHISKTSFEACIGRGVCSISYENDFLYHLLVCLESQWFKLSKGSTFDSINSDEIKSLSIAIPVNKEEQKAIAQVLSDIDTEITALEKRRAKTQAIKQGMMQELLTGRTRLINN